MQREEQNSRADARAQKRSRVQRVEDWDNARYSITPPRAALDARLTLIHFRLMAMLGRVNTAQGWCEMSQSAFAAALGYNRTSVVRAVKELVEWRYLEKRGQEQAGSARCHYRLLVDDPEPIELDEPTVVDAADDDAATHDVGTCSVGGDTSTCSVGGDTGVAREATHVSPNKDTALDQRSKTTTPTPQAGRESDLDDFGSGQSGRAAALTASVKSRKALEAMPPSAVVDRLLRPLVERRRFSATDHSAAFAAIVARAKSLPTPHLDKVLDLVLAADVTVKLERVLAAVDAVKRCGLMVVITRRAQPDQWAAWLRHFERTEPKVAALMARYDSWQVRAEWPPQSQPTDGRPAA